VWWRTASLERQEPLECDRGCGGHVDHEARPSLTGWGTELAGASVVGVTPARYGAPASRSEPTTVLSGRCEPDVWQLIENRAGASWMCQAPRDEALSGAGECSLVRPIDKEV
jgi:hypothetical protein